MATRCLGSGTSTSIRTLIHKCCSCTSFTICSHKQTSLQISFSERHLFSPPSRCFKIFSNKAVVSPFTASHALFFPFTVTNSKCCRIQIHQMSLSLVAHRRTVLPSNHTKTWTGWAIGAFQEDCYIFRWARSSLSSVLECISVIEDRKELLCLYRKQKRCCIGVHDSEILDPESSAPSSRSQFQFQEDLQQFGDNLFVNCNMKLFRYHSELGFSQGCSFVMNINLFAGFCKGDDEWDVGVNGLPNPLLIPKALQHVASVCVCAHSLLGWVKCNIM